MAEYSDTLYGGNEASQRSAAQLNAAACIGAPHIIPPTLKCFAPTLICDPMPGPTRDQPIFSVTIPEGQTRAITNKRALTIHNGPSARRPVLARMTKVGCFPHKFAIEIPSQGAQQHSDVLYLNGKGIIDWSHSLFQFSLLVGKDTAENFEWRGTRGGMVQGSKGGWKLVWLSSPSLQVDRVEAADDALCYSSDGREVVATITQDAERSNVLSGDFRFSFHSTGLTGLFGSIWEVTSLITALKLWWSSLQHIRHNMPTPNHGLVGIPANLL